MRLVFGWNTRWEAVKYTLYMHASIVFLTDMGLQLAVSSLMTLLLSWYVSGNTKNSPRAKACRLCTMARWIRFRIDLIKSLYCVPGTSVMLSEAALC